MYYGPGDFGRIHRDAFIISTSVLYAIAVLATGARFVIQRRIQLQTSFSLDDACVLLGLCTLTTAIAMFHHHIMKYLYLEAYTTSLVTTGNTIPDHINKDIANIHGEYPKRERLVFGLVWATVVLAKFSFLFLFRRLIHNIRKLRIYWWFVIVANVAVFGYGFSIDYMWCPESSAVPSCMNHGAHVYAHMSLDIIIDLLILAIPIIVVWKIQIRWAQKIVLAFSLCLTAFIIATTVARVAFMAWDPTGLGYHTTIDVIWVFYWSLVSAEVAIFMAAAVSFRTFFIAHRRKTRSDLTPQEQARKFFKESLLRRAYRKESDPLDSLDQDPFTLPAIPKAYMTGMRTYMDSRDWASDLGCEGPVVKLEQIPDCSSAPGQNIITRAS